MSERVVKTKKKCCKSKPRCKKCPVVYKRLAKHGLAERRDKRSYTVVAVIKKKDLKAARRGK